jgi:predicted O-linked N-acetylglucosamine transferase (SPINDLY family)
MSAAEAGGPVARAAAHAAAGRIDDALAACLEALARSPERAELHYNVATLRAATGDFAGAEASFREAATLRPGWPQAFLGLGHLYFRQEKFDDARRAFEQASVLAPDSVEALFNLAAALDRMRRWPEALPLLRRARAIAPADARVWLALRNHLLLFHREEDAFEDFRAFEVHAKPTAAVVTAGLMSARVAPGTEYEEKYLPLALDWRYGKGDAVYAGIAVAHAEYYDVPREKLRRLHERYDKLRQDERHGHPDLAAWRATRSTPIRIGYLSADLRNHVMGRLMLGVFARHDRKRFAVHAYSLGKRELEDGVTAEIRAHCDDFVRVDDVGNYAAAQRIAADRLDLLVDLMGHSGSSRPGILLYKPAPVIITHLGLHGPVGLRQVDFKLSDRHVDLPDAAQYQIERPLPLDCCVLPVRRVAPAAQGPSRAELGIDPAAFAFGVFVSLRKLSPRCLGLWRAILDRVPKGVLAFSPQHERERAVYLRRLASFGIAAERIVFLPFALDDAADRARYRLIDAVLDTLPYTGGDTTAAALDRGVPVVTRVGERAAERMTYSLLAHLGATDTVARTDEEYVAIACRLAEDTGWRLRVAAEIAARLPASGLADFDLYARALEAAYLRALELGSVPAA